MKPIALVALTIAALASSNANAQAAPSSSSSSGSSSYALGFKGSDATPSTFKQKNTYVAADDPSTYYGGNLGNLSLNSVLSAVVSAATGSSAPTGRTIAAAATTATAAASTASTTTAAASTTPATTTSTPAATSTTTAATSTYFANPGTNDIRDASSSIVATYNPVSGQFITTEGVVVPPDSAEYSTYKGLIATATAAGTPTVTADNSRQ